MIQKKKTNNTEDICHELSIQVGLNGLSFCIRDGLTHKIKSLERHHFSDVLHPEALTEQLKKAFQEHEALKGSFKNVILIHENELSAFVPKDLFDDKQLSDYLKFNVKVLEDDFVTYDTLNDHELINVYIPYVNVNNALFEHFGVFEYHHFSSILVRTLLGTFSEKEKTTMYVHVQKEHFEIVVVNNQKLSFYNSFSYTTEEDFIYYILFTAEQLALNPELFPLYLLGAIDEASAMYTRLHTYVRHLFFFETPSVSFERDIKQSAPHNEMVLLNSF